MRFISEFHSSLELVSFDRHAFVIGLTFIATAYFVITWGWASFWGIIGARISRDLRIQMVDRALGMDQTYYETECPDVS